jgi:uncharacterized protein (TIGR00369 family)
LNGRIQAVQLGEVVVEFDVREEMTNPAQILHGGIICAMLDDVIGMSSATLGYAGFLISIDFHVDYLGKAKKGDKVVATAKIIREGHRIVHAEAQLKDSQENPIATANSNLLRTTKTPDYVRRFQTTTEVDEG